eukprot:CAMPEP_0172459234 /NCGR_PEP_ID=MMETSP1065-20121228/31653_1 /TAXON_ID=265537 /ORGANISM="Amphiprora paludosa, Strain CCMP125" /LENGTH=162 /DNA_ID=CAMNT_0013213845 /DNA_START=1 /DNA_END=486 /DNA_ORIENTATION=+
MNSLSSGKTGRIASEQRLKVDMGPKISVAFNSAVAGLMFLNSLSADIIDCAPVAPAILECATAAYQSGSMLLKIEHDLKREFDKNQAKCVADVLNQLDDQSFRLTKRTKGMSTNPHIRRAEYHVNVLSQYYRVLRGKAKRIAGEGERVEHQADVRGFFKKPK